MNLCKEQSEENQLNTLCDKFSGLYLTQPKQVQKNNVTQEILAVFGKLELFQDHFRNLESCCTPFSLSIVSTNSMDYGMVTRKFNLYGTKVATRMGRYWKNSNMSIDRIMKVINPYLTAQFELKGQRKQEIYSICKQKYLFHGTESYKIDAICKNNFDWRLHGTNVGHKFGQGVSFSPKAGYASDYPRYYSPGQERSMILAQTIYSRQTVGDGTMVIPPEPFNSSTRENGMVVVKYEDADYNPEFVIYYSK